jgi:curli biogenesis system outer membrane secretion channel CsgG
MKGRNAGLLFLSLLIWLVSACRTGGASVRTEAAGGVPVEAAGVAEAAGGSAESGPEAAETAASLREALSQACGELAAELPGPAAVAVISVGSGDPAEGEYAAEELILLLVTSKKYRIVDRRSLDIIRGEQNFQLSGEVDDDTAVSIGHLIGAEIVITGSIVPYNAAK